MASILGDLWSLIINGVDGGGIVCRKWNFLLKEIATLLKNKEVVAFGMNAHSLLWVLINQVEGIEPINSDLLHR